MIIIDIGTNSTKETCNKCLKKWCFIPKSTKKSSCSESSNIKNQFCEDCFSNEDTKSEKSEPEPNINKSVTINAFKKDVVDPTNDSKTQEFNSNKHLLETSTTSNNQDSNTNNVRKGNNHQKIPSQQPLSSTRQSNDQSTEKLTDLV